MRGAAASAGGAAPAPLAGSPLPRVSSRALLRVFFRSLFLQAAWNPRGMQNLGFAHALAPALEDLYPERGVRALAVARHLEFFNCHPYLAAAILGATARCEERVARGEAGPETVSALKRALAPPFAALGDGFFWLALRPAAALLAAALEPSLGLLALVVFLVLYDGVHVVARVALFAEGYLRGEGIVALVARAHVPRGTWALKAAGSVLAGVLSARALLDAFAPAAPGGAQRPFHALLVGATIVGATLALPRLRFAAALYLALGIGLAVGSGFF